MNIEPDYKKAIHFRPSENNKNVRCLNGSAYIRRTLDINKVTCAKCLDKKHNVNYWNHFFLTNN